jgi:fumarate hydratase class II
MFEENLLQGLKANTERIAAMNEQSLSLATSLAPLIGYDAAAKIAKESFATGKTVRDIAFGQEVLPKEQLEDALDLRSQTEAGIAK